MTVGELLDAMQENGMVNDETHVKVCRRKIIGGVRVRVRAIAEGRWFNDQILEWNNETIRYYKGNPTRNYFYIILMEEEK